MAKPITFLHTNIRGIRANKEELLQLIKEQNVTVASINETFLNSNTKLQIPGFNILRRERPTGNRGGVALLIKEDVEFSEITFTLTDQELNHNEYVATRLFLNNNTTLLTASIYCPPGTTPSPQLITKLTHNHNQVILMGDFNAKHTDFNCKSTNQSGRVLSDIINNTNLVLLNNNEPTHIHCTRSITTTDILDLILCSPDLASKLLTFSVSHDIGSDHLPVTASFSLQLHQPPARKIFNYKKANWEKFKTNIRTKITSSQPMDLNQMAAHMGHILRQAREETIPTITQKPPQKQLPPHILKLITIKRKKRRQFIRTRTPAIKTEVNRLQNQIKQQLILHKQKQWDNFYRDLNNNTNPRTFWKKIKAINGNMTNNITPALKSNGQTFHRNSDKANLFRDHLQNVHSNHTDPNFDPEWENTVNKANQDQTFNSHSTLTLPMTPADHPLTRPVTLCEIKTHLEKTKNKAPGEDQIDNILLKQSPDEYLHLLSHLFTTCLITGHFPQPWKSAIITMIPKPGKDPQLPTSYRPISLLSHIGKLFERITTTRLSNHIEHLGLIGQHQAGFRKNRSTTDNILRLSEHMHKHFHNKKELTLAIFFDIEKAFDRLWHNGLIYKLKDPRFQLPHSTINLIHNFLHNREIKIKVSTTISTPFSPEAGVPQGAVLSPLLFITYISDIYHPPPTIGHISQFADDLCYWSSSKSPQLAAKKISTCIQEIEHWSNKWRIKLNSQKTQCIMFTKKPTHRQPINISLYGNPITITKTAKFLGVTFQQNMTWTTHISNITTEARKRLNHLKALTGKKNGASPETIIKVYTSYIRSIFEYAMPSWITVSDYQLQQLQIIQNKAIKLAYRLPNYINTNYIHKISGLSTIKQRQNIISQKYFNRAIHNPSLQPIIHEAQWTTSTPLSIMLHLSHSKPP